uniref:Uncharacterized protein n=1 Tax=Cucumis melo TaxID=3656 RepID=A0A9I9E5H9_CUCME
MIRIKLIGEFLLPALKYFVWLKSPGKGRGKLARDREGSMACHMGTQFCFRVYVSIIFSLVVVNYIFGFIRDYHRLNQVRNFQMLLISYLSFDRVSITTVKLSASY